MTPELQGFDTRALAAELDGLDRLAARFGATMARSLGQAAASGRDLGDVLRSLALSLSAQALSAGLAPLSRLAGSMFAGIAGSGGDALSALASSATGAMTQAALPAARTWPAPSVTVNIATPDVESFRRSQSQVAANLARGVSRGLRNL